MFIDVKQTRVRVSWEVNTLAPTGKAAVNRDGAGLLRLLRKWEDYSEAVNWWHDQERQVDYILDNIKHKNILHQFQIHSCFCLRRTVTQSCINFPSAGITGVDHHPGFLYFKNNKSAIKLYHAVTNHILLTWKNFANRFVGCFQDMISLYSYGCPGTM